MTLEWIDNVATGTEGDRIMVHYLVDVESEQCLATITEPLGGNLLFSTDLRVCGYDRAFMSLSAAKSYCEWAGLRASLEGARELENEFRERPTEKAVRFKAGRRRPQREADLD